MQKLKNKASKLSPKQITIIGVICACIGISLLTYNYINSKINYAYNYMNIKLLKSEQPELSYTKEKNQKEDSPNPSAEPSDVVDAPTVEEQAANDKNSESYYIGTLEIPNLGFTRGFLDKNSKLNNVNKNIAVMSASDYPDKPSGNFIVAGHSGNSSIAFFQNLYQLVIGDVAYVSYSGKRYTYQITNIYLQPKVGHIAIYRDTSKKTLTLITCTKDDRENQTVYIAELINEKNG